LSAKGQFESRWDTPIGGERDLLDRALADERAWEVILHAKRLLQANSSDDQAEAAIEELGPHHLVLPATD